MEPVSPFLTDEIEGEFFTVKYFYPVVLGSILVIILF